MKIFRRFRFRSILNNKISDYLKYATGEIILVVIGILIALQVNNWSERRKQVDRSKKYLEELLKDLRADQQELIRKNSFFAKEKEQYDWYLSKDSFSLSDLDSVEMAEYLFYPDFILHDAVFNRMQNSGFTHLIGYEELDAAILHYYTEDKLNVKKNNDHLLMCVANWHALSLELKQTVEPRKLEFQQNGEASLKTMSPQEEVDQKTLDMLTSPAYRRLIADQYETIHYTLQMWDRHLRKTEQLIEKIENALN